MDFSRANIFVESDHLKRDWLKPSSIGMSRATSAISLWAY